MDPLSHIASSAAGSPAAQTTGADVQRSQQAAAIRKGQLAAREKARAAAGIAATDGEDLKPDDRDGDGRRPWEHRAIGQKPAAEQSAGGFARSPDGEDRGARLDVVG